MGSYLKSIIYTLFFIFITLFVSNVHAQDLNSANYKACIDNSYKVSRSCDNRIKSDEDNSAYKCLFTLDAEDTIWNCEPFDGETVLLGNCADAFANNVCSQIPRGTLSGSCTDTCNQTYKEEFKSLFATKYNQTNVCPTTINSKTLQINNGDYDAFMRVSCNSFDLADCQTKMLGKVKADTQNQCNEYVDTSKSEIEAAVSSRYTTAVPTPIPEAVAARDTLTKIIDRSQRNNCNPAEDYLSAKTANPLTCNEYQICLSKILLEEVPYTDDIWSCDDPSEQTCYEHFRNAFNSTYEQWLRSTISTNIQVSTAKPEQMSCSGFYEVAQLLDKKGYIYTTDIYNSKREERRNNGIEDKSIFTPSSDIDDYEALLNCGFADNPNKNRCCPTDVDIPELTDLTVGSDFKDDSCWFGLANCPPWMTSAGLQEKAMLLVGGDLNEKITELQALSEQDGGQLKACYVGTCQSNGFCEGGGGADVCIKYIDKGEKAYESCSACMQHNVGSNQDKKVFTALGCINTSFDGFISDVFSLGIGIAGLTALFCIIYAAFMLQTSQGNPEQIQKAQENLTSCISGLILIIFSVLFLRIIGGDILKIPGFTNQIDTSVNQSNNTPTIAAQLKIQPTTAPIVNPTITSSPISTITQIPTATPTLSATPLPIGIVTGTIRAGSALYFSNDTVNPSTTDALPNARFIYQTDDNLYLYTDSINAWVAKSSIDGINEAQMFQVVEVVYPDYLTSNISTLP